MAVTTVVATTVALTGGTTVVGSLVVLLLIALLITKEIGAHAGNPRLFALQRVLTVALVPLSVAGAVALIQQLGAVI